MHIAFKDDARNTSKNFLYSCRIKPPMIEASKGKIK